MIEWLKTNWFLLSALVSVSVAWGETRMQVENLKDGINAQQVQQQKIEDIQKGQSRLDERTINIQRDMTEQRQLLLQILQSNKQIIRQTQ